MRLGYLILKVDIKKKKTEKQLFFYKSICSPLLLSHMVCVACVVCAKVLVSEVVKSVRIKKSPQSEASNVWSF